MTAVCPYSNYLRAIPVPDKTVTTADLCRHQWDVYNTKARHLSIPDGKVVYMHKIPSHKEGNVTRFVRNFDGPYLITGHPFKRSDMFTLKHIATGETIPHPVNIEKVVIIQDPELHDLQASNDSVVELQPDTPTPTPVVVSPDSDLVQVAYQFGKFPQSLPQSQPLHLWLANLCMSISHLLAKF